MAFNVLVRTTKAPVPMGAGLACGKTNAAPKPYRRVREKPDWPSIGIVVAVHAAAIYGLLQLDVVRDNVMAALPMMVDLLKPEAPKPPPPAPKPLVKPPPRVEPPPIFTTTAPTAATFDAPPQPLAPPPPPAPVAVTAPPPPPPPAVPITPPNFNAAYLENPPPRYPSISRKLGETGQVVLRVRVTTDGRAERIEVNKSSGYERLDLAAAEVVEKWRFAPAKQGDQAIAAWVLVPITFKLEG